MASEGKKSRDERPLQLHSGSWGTVSADLIRLLADLYALSKNQADSTGGNLSRFAYAGIPLLLSAWQSFVIEHEGLLNLESERKCLRSLTVPGPKGLLDILRDRYRVSNPLFQEASDLVEVRNEIIHPVSLRTGTKDNWPEYLRHLKEKGLLQTTGKKDADYILLGQLASHRLFAWTCRVTRDLFQEVQNSDQKTGCPRNRWR